jgi:protocatechuate 3,4-dioxygenase beta subunit
MSHDDDAPVGRVLSRREVLALLGLSSAATILGCRTQETPEPVSAAPPGGPASAAGTPGAASRAAVTPTAASRPVPSCVVRPEQTEGPYFVDERLDRADIRSNPGGALSEGVPLTIAFDVSRISKGKCTPLHGARVDVWHCDSRGAYSDVSDFQFDTRGQKFLRGHQLTDASGAARFTTIYPGWYPGRTVHIHFKIRTEPGSSRGHEFTSQLYFDDALTDRVYQRPPYAGREDRERRNENDGIYRDGGDQLMLAVTEHEGGYAATFEIGLDLS